MKTNPYYYLRRPVALVPRPDPEVMERHVAVLVHQEAHDAVAVPGRGLELLLVLVFLWRGDQFCKCGCGCGGWVGGKSVVCVWGGGGAGA